MADRIEVGFKEGIRDALGEKTKKRIIDNLGLPVANVATIEVYTVAGDLIDSELQEAAKGPLSDPVIQDYSINRPLAGNFDWLIEVGFRPGVTDNVGKTAREALTLLLRENVGSRKISVYTSRQYLISGPVSKADAENIASYRTLEKLGFRREAHFVESYLMDGVYTSEYHYGLLQREWRENLKQR